MCSTKIKSALLFALLSFATLIGLTPQSLATTALNKPSDGQLSKKIVILGDSLTEGYGVVKEAAYPALLEEQLTKDGFNVQIVNAGISGSTTASGPSRIKWLMKSKPDIVFITLGSNDGLRGVDLKETKKNLKATIQIAKEQKAKVWLAALEVPPNYGKDYVTKFRSMFKQVAEEEKIPLSPFLLDGVAGEKKFNQPDGIHPNEEGHKIIAEKMVKFFKSNL